MTEDPKLTIFAVPKAFDGQVGLIQRNAIRSWSRLPGVEIVLLGDETGTAAMAEEVGARHQPQLACNEFGTPYLDSCFEVAAAAAATGLLAYVNADIILMDDFVKAVNRVAARRRRFLLAGQRMDIDLNTALDFNAGWDQALNDRVDREGRSLGAWGIDFFVFPRDLFRRIPPFAIGRWVWDNWLLYEALRLGATLVDATPSVRVIHQRHDYNHAGDEPQPLRNGPEAMANRALVPLETHWFGLLHADRILYSWGLCPALSPRRIQYRAMVWKFRYPRLVAPLRLLRRGWRRLVGFRGPS